MSSDLINRIRALGIGDATHDLATGHTLVDPRYDGCEYARNSLGITDHTQVREASEVYAGAYLETVSIRGMVRGSIAYRNW